MLRPCRKPDVTIYATRKVIVLLGATVFSTKVTVSAKRAEPKFGLCGACLVAELLD